MQPLPDSLLMETYSTCNRKCAFCAYGQDRFLKNPWAKESLSWDLIRKVLTELQEAQFSGRLSWYRINEPLLDERIEEIYTLSRQCLPTAWLTLVTNGDFLKPSRIEALFAAGLNVLGISLYDDPSYRRMVQMLEKLPWEAGPPGTSNSPQRIELRDHRKPEFWGFCNRGGTIEREKKLDASHKNCLRPSSQLAVRANGKAVLCCNDLFGEVEVGDLQTQSISAIWNSTKLDKYRKHLREKGRTHLALCETCDYSGEKAIVKSIKEWDANALDYCAR